MSSKYTRNCACSTTYSLGSKARIESFPSLLSSPSLTCLVILTMSFGGKGPHFRRWLVTQSSSDGLLAEVFIFFNQSSNTSYIIGRHIRFEYQFNPPITALILTSNNLILIFLHPSSPPFMLFLPLVVITRNCYVVPPFVCVPIHSHSSD